MKDYFNPLFTLIIVGGMAWCCATQGGISSSQQEAWVLSLCVVGVLVNGALALARAFTRQLSMGVVVWAAVYFAVRGPCAPSPRESSKPFTMRSVKVRIKLTHSPRMPRENPSSREPPPSAKCAMWNISSTPPLPRRTKSHEQPYAPQRITTLLC